MIDNLVEALSGKFINDNEPFLREDSKLELDFTWNSVYLVDHLLNLTLNPSKLKKVKESKIDLQQTILPLSAYLGSVIYHKWIKIFPKNSVKLVLNERPKPRVVLKVSSGFEVSAESPLSIDLTEAVEGVLKKTNFDFTKGVKLNLELGAFRFLHLTFGLITATSPLIKGKWSEFSFQELSFFLNDISNLICEEVQLNYVSVNPGKEKILNPTVFRPNLCFVPLGFEEKYYCHRAIFHLTTLFKTEVLTKAELIELGSLLIYSPSITESAVGYIILEALNPEYFKSVITEFALNFPLITAKLLPTSSFFKEEVLSHKPWHYYSKVNNPEMVQTIFNNDLSHGLSPHFFCSDRTLLFKKEYRAYFEGLSFSLLGPCIKRGKELILEYPSPSLILQQSYLEFILGKFDEATLTLTKLNLKDLNDINKQYLEHLDLCLYMSSEISSINEIFKKRLLKALKSPEIDLLKRKKLFELAFLKIKKQDALDAFKEFVKELKDIITLNLYSYIIHLNFLDEHESIGLNKSLLRCYWHQSNVFKTN